MKWLSDFIVSKRYWILGVMLGITILCAVLSLQVSVNTDMTKYLPDDSSMKIGMNIMEEEFPEMEMSNSIRVMAEGLDKTQKEELLAQLEALPYVESVAHDDSEDYNKEEYSLFTIGTSYDYGSDEEQSIEDALATDFEAYNIVYQNDSDEFSGLTNTVLLTALVILLVILFAMSESWLEPILFLLTIGFAVVINSGTNIFMGEISSITSSITALLQLVLSMDYSIILINRYRQERATGIANRDAMKAAVHHSFSSIASSSLTTVVGLLMLVFMNFKIGMDLGIVLAKGVFISMVCVITILPCLILMSDRLITKTAKKSLHIPMGRVARFSYRFRYVLTGLFIIAFVGFSQLQGGTDICFTLESEDPIADHFPSTNMLVMIYDNEDEAKVAELAETLEEHDAVKQVLGYPNLLGKQYTAQELVDSIETLGDSLGADTGDAADIDPALLELLYYHYYDGTTESLPMSEFLRFLSEDVLTNDTFANAIDEDMRSKADTLAKFSDPDELTMPKSILELADFFDMDTDMVKSLMLFYYTEYGGVDTGTITLPEFVSFLQNDVAHDPMFSSYLDSGTTAQIATLAQYTDKNTLQAQQTASQLATVLGMDESMVNVIFALNHAGDVNQRTMTLAQFTAFLNDSIMSHTLFAASFDDSAKAQLQYMNSLIQYAVSRQELSASEIAAVTGMEETDAANLFAYQSMISGTQVSSMTLPDFLTVAALMQPENQQLAQLNQIVSLATSDVPLDAGSLSQVFGMDDSMIKLVFCLYYGGNASDSTMSMEELVDFIRSDFAGNPVLSGYLDSNTLSQLSMAQAMIKGSINGTAYSPAELAKLIGMDSSQLDQLYLLYISKHGDISNWQISVQTLVGFLNTNVLTDPDYANLLEDNMRNTLTGTQTMIGAVVSGTQYTSADAYKILSALTDELDENMVEMLYFYNASQKHSDPAWTLSIEQMFLYLCDTFLEDSRFASFVDEDMRAELADVQETLEEGVELLKTDKYSRLILYTNLASEGNETTAFLSQLHEDCSGFEGEYYLIGTSAMNYEMSRTFHDELQRITLLTSIAIFLIVLLTFRNLLIPFILVLLVQCSVYITITIVGVQGYSIYFLALLIVECILMGSTIDYGILFTNYYRENKRHMPTLEALGAAYKGSIHTIMTSGLIMVLVTGIIGYTASDPTLAQIVRTISTGAFCAILMILFILPGILSAFGKWITTRNNKR